MAVALRAVSKGKRTASGMNFTVSTHTETQPGDLMVLFVAIHGDKAGNNYTISTPAGWTSQVTKATTTGLQGAQGIYCFTRTMVAGDSSWTIVGATGSPCMRSWAIVSIYGNDTSSATDATASTSSVTNTTSHNIASVVTKSNNSWMVGAWSDLATNPPNTPPASMTHLGSILKAGDDDFHQSALGIMYELIPSAGATGTRTLTAGSSTCYVSVTLAIGPGSAAQSFSDVGDVLAHVHVGAPEAHVQVANSAEIDALLNEEAHVIALLDATPYDADGAAEDPRYFSTGPWDGGEDTKGEGA